MEHIPEHLHSASYEQREFLVRLGLSLEVAEQTPYEVAATLILYCDKFEQLRGILEAD